MTNHENQQRALVVGLGVAGMATAKRLAEIGWTVTIVERSPERRTGGYFIALFGSGTASSERMGISEALPSRNSTEGSTNWQVTRSGKRRPGMGFNDIPNGPRMLVRGDIEEALYASLPAAVDIQYDTVPVSIVQDSDGVDVVLKDRTDEELAQERYDLVLGADGLRSTVRRLVFGPDANFVKPAGYMIAATLLDEELPGFQRGDGLTLSEPGRSATLFAFKDRPPSLLFSYRTNDSEKEFSRPAADSIRRAFGPTPAGPVLGPLLEQFERAEDYIFDEAQQVIMRQWHHGRVALIGDAAWCMTLYSGVGASSGIAGGELLGTMIVKHGSNIPAALREWNRRMLPFISYQHENIQSSRKFFVTATRAEYLQEKAMTALVSTPPVRKLLMSAGTKKDLQMKDLDVAAP